MSLLDPTVRTTDEENLTLPHAEIIDAANRVTVWDDTSAQAATDVIIIISTAIRLAEEERKKTVKPFNDGVKHINNRFKKIMEPLDKALAEVKEKVLRFKQEQRKLAEDAARAAMEAARRCEPVPAPLAAPISVASTRGNFGSTHIKKTRKYKVTDINKVPADFIIRQVDHAKVTAAMNADILVDGIEYFEEESLVGRTS